MTSKSPAFFRFVLLPVPELWRVKVFEGSFCASEISVVWIAFSLKIYTRVGKKNIWTRCFPFFEIRPLTPVMGVRNLVIIDFRSYLRQYCDVTVSRKNTCDTAICRSIQCLQVPAQRLCRISYHFAGIRSRVRTKIDFHDFRHFQKSLKNQRLQISTFCLKNIEDICHISRMFCHFLDICWYSLEIGSPNMRKIIFV